MSILQTAKDLLKKGIALQDEELIAMANDLLGDVKKPQKKQAVKKTAKVKGVKKASRHNPPTTNEEHIDYEDFRVNNNSKIKGSKKKRVKGSGKNIFVDDRTLARSEDDKTPNYRPVARDRPKHKKITKQCRECKKPFVVAVGDKEVGEYKCNKCITGE